jgi:hypothetical protein
MCLRRNYRLIGEQWGRCQSTLKGGGAETNMRADKNSALRNIWSVSGDISRLWFPIKLTEKFSYTYSRTGRLIILHFSLLELKQSSAMLQNFTELYGTLQNITEHYRTLNTEHTKQSKSVKSRKPTRCDEVKTNSITGLNRPWGFQEVEAPRF